MSAPRDPEPPRPLTPYLAAIVLCLLVATIQNTLLAPYADRLRFIPYMPAIIVAAAWGGLGPGVLATILGTALAFGSFLRSPPTAQPMDAVRAAGIGLVVLSGFAISWVCESLRSARRRLEIESARLRDSEAFHAAMAELTWDFAFKGRVLTDGRLMLDSVTEGFERLMGLRLEQLEGPDAWLPLVHPDDRDRLLAELAGLGRGEMVEGDLRAQPVDGRDLWVRYRIRPTRRPDGVFEVVGAVENITERRRAIAEARRLLEHLHIITDSMGAAVTHCSRDLRYVWVSRAYLAWRGEAEDRVVGHRIVDVLGEPAFRALLPHFERVLAGETVEYEERVDVLGLGHRWIHAIYQPARGPSGTVDGWVAVVADVTARRNAEAELREADRRKDEFLAILAHELRNPLAPLLSALEVLRHERAEPAARAEAVAMMTRQVRQMVRLIDDLLDVARLTRGTLELRRERLDLVAAVHDAIETSRPLLERAGHVLTTELPAGPVPVDGDRVRLAQVFSNLVNNATRYSDQDGTIALSLTVDDHEARVTVRDRGVGIPAEVLPYVFDMFTRVDAGRARSRGGLGVGLGLVRRLVEMHGGSVVAHSDGAGHGSTFVVRLPLALDGVPARPVGSPSAPAQASPARRVLVVDDNEDAAVSLAHMLRLCGHHTSAVHDPHESLAVAARERPEIILLDLGMPGLDGYEVARRIRGEPWGRDTRLVAVTGWGRDEDRQHSRAAGFDAHLVKPVDLDTLRAMLASLPASDGAVP